MINIFIYIDDDKYTNKYIYCTCYIYVDDDKYTC